MCAARKIKLPGAGKSGATISFLWIMTVGPGTPVYGTKTKPRDSAAAPRPT